MVTVYFYLLLQNGTCGVAEVKAQNRLAPAWNGPATHMVEREKAAKEKCR
jgi:hypothetical protein